MNERLEQVGRRFARFVTEAVVARPHLWRLFRGPLRKQFDLIAATWEEKRSPEHAAPLRAALERIDRAPKRILDLGTGTGIAARALARQYPDAEVVGVDLSPRMIEEARERLPSELAGRVRYQVADASRLPVADGVFELVVLLNMIPFFDELARVTAPGGAIVFSFSSGPETPIYVPPERIHEGLGFERYEEVETPDGTAVVAWKARS